MAERALSRAEEAAVAKAVRELSEPTSKSVREHAARTLGLEAGGLEGVKKAVKACALLAQEAVDARSAERRVQNETAFYADKEEGETRKGKFGKNESAAVVAAAEAAAAAHGVSVEDLVSKGAWRGKVGRKRANPWKEIAAQFPQRSENSLYCHVKRLRHEGHEKRSVRWNMEDSDLLKQYFDRYGPDWTAIGKEFGRTPAQCRDRYRTLFGEPSLAQAARDTVAAETFVVERVALGEDPGPPRAGGEAIFRQRTEWTEAEVRKLTECHIGRVPVLDVDDESKISFAALAANVGTRSRQQCKRKYYDLKNKAYKWGEILLTETAQQLELCEKLQSSGAEDESEVVWGRLGWDLPGCCTAYAIRCWTKLKRRHKDEGLDFVATLDVLVPELREQLHDELWADECAERSYRRAVARRDRRRAADEDDEEEEDDDDEDDESSSDEEDSESAAELPSKAASEADSSSDDDSDEDEEDP